MITAILNPIGSELLNKSNASFQAEGCNMKRLNYYYKKVFLKVFAFIFLACPLYGQEKLRMEEEDLWTSYWEEDTKLIGFKDSKGNIKIPSKFVGGGTIAHKFKNIMAVVEQMNDHLYDQYYLLKDGRQVGRDSIFLWDNTPDCESEGKIRFHVEKTDKIGFFGKNGEIVIPAVYNYALPFRNGLTVAIKGAEKICWDGTPYRQNNSCEHWRWKGGDNVLINEANETLIKGFDYTRSLDLSTIKISEKPFESSSREFFKGTNGKYYSFVNMKRDFQNWFDAVFLNPDNLLESSFQEITFWSEDKKDRISVPKKEFLERNKAILIKK